MVHEQTIRREFRVHGLKSIYCAERLRGALSRLPGVRCYVLYKRAYAEVEAPAEVSIEVLQAIAEREGYRLQPMIVKARGGEPPP
ncbi:hypothetical protein [Sedimenticola hydrogenitrophicus]|uniref:hypothetical protein n=1 Tax=Sedimenticola hydrogenitrophicus TaxID=2967975 RepID=UPI0023B011FE|nr:hypothetical protein [Sedimenticola hydrogenitrophicus]